MAGLKKHKRFTILELLIVIGIIAVLACILMPALNSARGRAQGIKCSGNLKQIAITLFQYSNDTGFLPAGYNGSDTWNMMLIRQGYIHPDFPEVYYIKPEASIFLCPSVRKGEAYYWTGEKPLWYSTSYPINTYMSSTYSIYPNLSQIQSPSVKMLNIEEAPSYHSNYWTCDDSTHPLLHKHSNGLNILFYDGHASWYLQSKIPRQHVDGESIQIGTNQDLLHWWDYRYP